MRMKNILGLLAAQMMIAAQSDDVFYVRGRNIPKQSPNNPRPIRTNAPKMELREFRVKGETIMAYSKKDAIKRLNHQKRKKLWQQLKKRQKPMQKTM